MNKNNIKETICLAFWDAVEDHPYASIASFVSLGTLFLMLLSTSPILTALMLILVFLVVFLVAPTVLIISFIHHYCQYKRSGFDD